jgi:hypothetical protein
MSQAMHRMLLGIRVQYLGESLTDKSGKHSVNEDGEENY